MRRFGLGVTLGAILGAAGCGGGGSSTPARFIAAPVPAMDDVVVSGGAAQVAPETSTVDRTSAQDKTRLGIGAPGRSFALTTPAGDAIDMALTGAVGGARGDVVVRLAVAGGSGAAGADLAAAGLLPRAGNLIDDGPWLRTVGDGFARITLSGAVTAPVTLILEREAGGRKTTATITLTIGPKSPVNPSFPATTAFTGLKSTTDLFSSEAPIFGLPAIAGSGDRVSVICYDSVEVPTTNPGPGRPAGCMAPYGIERKQRRLQLDTVTKAKSQGETADLGRDSSYWRDTEVAGRFNVIAIAQAGGAGVTVELSFDRGGTFPAKISLGSGDWTRLVAIDMAPDYTTGVVFWATSTEGTDLFLAEGRASAFDANNSPSEFAFDAPVRLMTLGHNVTPLVSDVQYSACGDLLVACGHTKFESAGQMQARLTMTVSTFRRHAGTTKIEGPTTVDLETEIVPSDPSLAITGCGGAAEVYVAYESKDGARIKKSADGGATFATSLTFGTTSAHAPRVFARPGPSGTVVDCLYLDAGPAGVGDDLNLLRIDGDLATGKSVHALVAARLVTGTAGAQDVESVGWFGFDACELGGDLWLSVHEQRQAYYTPFPFGRGGVFTAAGAGGGAGAASAPAVLYPGMTQPVPAFSATATHKLRVLQID